MEAIAAPRRDIHVAPERKRKRKRRGAKTTPAPTGPCTELAIGCRVQNRKAKIEVWAARCTACSKWRRVEEVSAYEVVRAQAEEQPFVCERASAWGRNVSCTDEEDVSPGTDESLVWALDVPNIPTTPAGWTRKVHVRRPGCTRFADVEYYPPPPRNTERIRSPIDVVAILGAIPEYEQNGVRKEHFSFDIPAPLRDGYVVSRRRGN